MVEKPGTLELPFAPEPSPPEETEKIYSVGELSALVQIIFEQSFAEEIWVSGEVSNYRGKSASGHTYFNLKDQQGLLKAVLFRNDGRKIQFKLEEGMQVLARGRLQVYPPHGSYQLVLTELKPAGVGELYRRFEQLKKKLEGRGWFAEERKRQLPPIPQRIGLITSPTGAVLRDLLQGFTRRFPRLSVVLFPAKVQGEGSALEIARAISLANQISPPLDLCILARGGGSIEDLWSFNEEVVAEAIYSAKIPIVSAVGHQTDFTIADFVADLRAATPTAAAELVAPQETALKKDLSLRLKRLLEHIKRTTQNRRQALDAINSRPLMRQPARLLDDFRLSLDDMGQQVLLAGGQKLEGLRNELNELERGLILRDPKEHWRALAGQVTEAKGRLMSAITLNLKHLRGVSDQMQTALEGLSPLAVLSRGYSIATDKQGRVVKRATGVKLGQDIDLRLHQGALDCRVTGKKKDDR